MLTSSINYPVEGRDTKSYLVSVLNPLSMAQHPLKDGFNPGIVSTLGPWDPGNTGPGLESGVINLNNNLRPHPPGVGRIEEKVQQLYTNNIYG